MTISEWLKSMQEAGFTGYFVATNGDHKYKGFVTEDGIKAQRQKTKAESRAEFLAMKDKLSK